MPDQTGRVAVVTGASAGIGLATASALAARGATVVLACRDATRGARAATTIASSGALHVAALDLASLASVRTAAEEIRSGFSRVDLLVNNAGVMATPFQLSEYGVELTFATNHLGHFAFTGLLLDALVAASGSRVVTVSSIAHRRGDARFDDLGAADGYAAGAAYERSKLANLLFAFELQDRLAASGAETISVAAHPGIARTDLWRTSSWLERVLIGPRLRRVTGWLAQDADAAALPTLRAATDPAVRGGEYHGPAGPLGYTGAPVRSEASSGAHDDEARSRLWQLSEELTGVVYGFPSASDEPSQA
jgi:NAD(P)-dependent dehydrogenase (short-subunit alcohol dehydrogenase family)